TCTASRYSAPVIDRPAVVVHDSVADLAEAAADQAAEVIRTAVQQRAVCNAMFATGNSQLAFTDALRTRDVPWEAVVAFHMDEYVGVSIEHPASFQRGIRRRIPAHVVHLIDGT